MPEPQVETGVDSFKEMHINELNECIDNIQQIGYGNEPEPDVNQVIEEEFSQDPIEQLSGNTL